MARLTRGLGIKVAVQRHCALRLEFDMALVYAVKASMVVKLVGAVAVGVKKTVFPASLRSSSARSAVPMPRVGA